MSAITQLSHYLLANPTVRGALQAGLLLVMVWLVWSIIGATLSAEKPSATATTASAWMILGGPALFLADHAAFKLVVWRYVSWSRLAGVAALALLALAARTIPELALAAAAATVVAAVAAVGRLPWPPHPGITSPG